MVNGRAKGAGFERDVAKLLHAELGISFKRNLEQYRAGFHDDLTPDDPAFPWSIECKRYAGGAFSMVWWEQSVAAAQAQSKLPCVIYKFDRKPIRVAIPLGCLMDDSDGHIVDVSFEAFIYITREMMA
jgi:hypothetical protein